MFSISSRVFFIFIFLQSLISKPPLRDSEDLKQFLGVTEGKKISFIKPSVAQIVTQSVHVPRVDKVCNKVFVI